MSLKVFHEKSRGVGQGQVFIPDFFALKIFQTGKMRKN